MSESIAPCPFCGNAAASRLDTIADVDAWIYCDACSACGPTESTEAEAIAAWNAVQARIVALAARVAALEAQLLAAQQANTRLIARVVELEHERDAARKAAAGLTVAVGTPDLPGSPPCPACGHRTLAWGPTVGRWVCLGCKGSFPAEAIQEFPAEPPRAPAMHAEDAVASIASQLAVMIIQERLNAGHAITFASDLAQEVDLPRAQEPARLCDHCGLPLVSAHLVDEVVIADGARRASVHRACASAYPGWQLVAQARDL